MLVIGRKKEESIVLESTETGEQIKIKLVSKHAARIGVIAPCGWRILREESDRPARPVVSSFEQTV